MTTEKPTPATEFDEAQRLLISVARSLVGTHPKYLVGIALASMLPSSCSASHPEIRYQGDRCPLCEAGILAHLRRQREWSERTFGPGPRTKGVIDHIRKELAEIEADPTDISEWIDVTILALDGAWRAGHSPEQIWEALKSKQAKNETRAWPDWRTMPPDKAIEHDRTADATLSRPSSAPGAGEVGK